MFEEAFLQAVSHAGHGDSVSATGAQICGDGNVTTGAVAAAVAAAACGQELDLISSVGKFWPSLKRRCKRGRVNNN